MVMDWYSLRVMSGKEKSIEISILREVDEKDISSEVEEIFVPFEKIVQVRNNKKQIKVTTIEKLPKLIV